MYTMFRLARFEVGSAARHSDRDPNTCLGDMPDTPSYANGNPVLPSSSSALFDLKLDPLDNLPSALRSPTSFCSTPSCLLTPTAGLGGALTSANGASTTKTSSPAPSWYALCLIDAFEC